MKKTLLFLFFAAHTALPITADEEANRLLNLLDDVLRAAAELENPLPPPKPEAPGFYLLNKTGFTIREVYVRPDREESWGPNRIHDYFYKGQTILIPLAFPPDGPALYSIRVVDVDGDYYSKYDVTLTMFTTIEIAISDYGL